MRCPPCFPFAGASAPRLPEPMSSPVPPPLRYCNLNYGGLQKILKKHDKLLPQAPCIHFYKAHISSQPWVKGDHQDVQVSQTVAGLPHVVVT